MRGYCRSLQHSASGPPCLAAEIRGASAGTRGKLRGLQGPSADGRGDGARPSGERPMHGHLLVWFEQRSLLGQRHSRAHVATFTHWHAHEPMEVRSLLARTPSFCNSRAQMFIDFIHTHTKKSLTFQTENKQDNTDRESHEPGKDGLVATPCTALTISWDH